MPDANDRHRPWRRPLFYIVLTCCLVTGCLHAPVKKQPAPQTAPPPPPAPQSDELAVIEKEKIELRQALAVSNRKVQSLEQNIADLKIQVLENEAIIHNMRIRSDSQQNRLDAAIIDVVRSKAKLRSLESKAEAASTIAEAEIALKALKSLSTSSDEVVMEEIATAEQLLGISSEEFKNRNFGGALYLAGQTKSQVRSAQMRLSGEAKRTPLEGETSFVQPVPLKVLKANSNLREGPGLDHKISGRLNISDYLMGYSYKDRWIRVETQQGLTGWIFQTLVGAR